MERHHQAKVFLFHSTGIDCISTKPSRSKLDRLMTIKFLGQSRLIYTVISYKKSTITSRRFVGYVSLYTLEYELFYSW